MAKGRRTNLLTAALVMELKETQGRSENEISQLTGVPAGTVHNILSRAHGWDKIAEGEVFKRHRQEQNKALEQANRTLAKKSLEMAEGKMDKASYSQLVFGAAIMTDKARLLAGEPTEIHANLNYHAVASLDKLAALLGQSLVDDPNTIDITPTPTTDKQD
jgi:predicted transcriptional regulator